MGWPGLFTKPGYQDLMSGEVVSKGPGHPSISYRGVRVMTKEDVLKRLDAINCDLAEESAWA